MKLSTVAHLLLGAALLCSAWGGHLSPEVAPTWFSLGVIAFPLLALLAALALVIALVRRRSTCAAIMVAALLLSTPMLRITMPLHLPQHPAANADTIAVVTLNARNFEQTSTEPPNATLDYILHCGADVVLLQEVSHDGWGATRESTDTTFAPQQVALLDATYPYRSHDNDDVAIYSRFPFTRVEIARPHRGFDMVDYFANMEHNYAVAYDLHLPHGRQLRMVSAYLHSWNFSRQQRALLGGELTTEFDALPGSAVHGMSSYELMTRALWLRAAEATTVRRALDASPTNVVLCGDFNDVPGSYAYRTVRGSDMHDAWADTGLGYVSTYRLYHFYVRIDHILYRGNLAPVSVVRDKATTSDHYPQRATFVLK